GVVEMATQDVVLFLISPSVTEAQITDTIRALAQIFNGPRRLGAQLSLRPPPLPEQVLTPRQAVMLFERERVPVHDAIGRVSAETIGCFPPGQAIIVAGEIIT